MSSLNKYFSSNKKEIVGYVSRFKNKKKNSKKSASVKAKPKRKSNPWVLFIVELRKKHPNKTYRDNINKKILEILDSRVDKYISIRGTVEERIKQIKQTISL